MPFHAAQVYAYESLRRIVAMIAGSQSGKTSYGPWWLRREIFGDDIYPGRGPGDYLAVTATFDLFKLKMLPEFLRVFDEKLHLGRFWAGDKVFELRDPKTGEFWAKKSTDPMWGRVILRSASALGGLESATAKGMWLDECGQDDFSLDAWRALERRGRIHRARALLTTTLYNLGWLKLQVIDRAEEKGTKTIERTSTGGEIEVTDSAAANICLVQFDSIVNPMFPLDEFERARATMPDDEFQLFYRGRVARLRFLIYDVFDRKQHTCAPMPIPPDWKRYMGLDFGGVNTAALFYAEEPGTKRLYCYREYLAGGKSAKEHVEDMLNGELGRPYVVGGSKSEGQWRKEFAAAGLPVHEPDISDVDIGIQRVYAQHKLDGIVYFNNLEGVLDQKGRYRRVRDKQGNVTDEIENKNAFHFLDAERYIVGAIRRDTHEEAGVGW